MAECPPHAWTTKQKSPSRLHLKVCISYPQVKARPMAAHPKGISAILEKWRKKKKKSNCFYSDTMHENRLLRVFQDTSLYCFVAVRTTEYISSVNSFWDCRLVCFLQQYHRDLTGKEDKITTLHFKFERIL